jgi:hypothetical protein
MNIDKNIDKFFDKYCNANFIASFNKLKSNDQNDIFGVLNKIRLNPDIGKYSMSYMHNSYYLYMAEYHKSGKCFKISYSVCKQSKNLIEIVDIINN